MNKTALAIAAALGFNTPLNGMSRFGRNGTRRKIYPQGQAALERNAASADERRSWNDNVDRSKAAKKEAARAAAKQRRYAA